MTHSEKTSSSWWSRLKVSTLSNVLLITMIFTGVFFTAAFAILSKLIAEVVENWHQVQGHVEIAAEYSNPLTQSLAQLDQLTLIFLAFVPVAAGFFFVLMFATLRNKIVKPLKQLEEGIVAITSNNDYAKRIEQRHQDEIGEVINRFNGLTNSLDKSFKGFNQVLSHIANGEFDYRCTMKTNGDLEVLRNQLNASFDSVEITMNSLESVANGIANGDFTVRVDERVKGSIRHQVDQAMSSMDVILNEISDVMTQLNHGDFSGQILGDAQGQMDALKQDINASVAHIAKAIQAISEVVAAQAAGDLTQELPKGQFKGQLHNLKNAINYSIAKLKEVVEVVAETSDSVNVSAEKVATGSQSLSSQVQQQAAAVEETSATIEQLNSTVQANVHNAKQTSIEANAIMQKAQAGQTVMEKTIAAMQRIQTSSNEIADIVNLIDGIAFQTNLLALNAAVEAARAGEHGRGFAVVAGEVRSLAQKSADAAKDIKQLIDESVARINEGTTLVTESGESLKQINDSIQEISQQISDISTASAEQAQGVAQVHRAIQLLDSLSQQNNAMVGQTNHESENLRALAVNLQEFIQFFNTGYSHQVARIENPTKTVPDRLRIMG